MSLEGVIRSNGKGAKMAPAKKPVSKATSKPVSKTPEKTVQKQEDIKTVSKIQSSYSITDELPIYLL